MIHIYTGTGKGKTTCALGLAVRAVGQGLKVSIFQFFKPTSIACGERNHLKKVKNVRLFFCKGYHPMFAVRSSAKKEIKEFFKKIREIASKGKYDMMVLDEVINAYDQGFLSRRSFVSFLKSFPPDKELVLTGRGDIADIEQYADYITEMKEKKHPFGKNKIARKGIEF